jgi:hypothetical protein
MVYEQFSLCSLGCGWLDRAALWHEGEQWYVGMAVPKGGLGASWPCIVWAMRLVLVLVVVWCCFLRGLTSSSSLLKRPVFAPPISFMAFSLLFWMEVVSSWLGDGLSPGYIGISPVFH